MRVTSLPFLFVVTTIAGCAQYQDGIFDRLDVSAARAPTPGPALVLNVAEAAEPLGDAPADASDAQRTALWWVNHFRAKAGLAVLVNRPLNGLRGDRVVRLADPPVLVPKAPFPEALEEVQALEAIFAQDFAPKIRVDGAGPRPEQLLRWGKELATAPQQVQGLDAWAQLQQQRIGPEVNQVLQVLAQGFRADAGFSAWAKRYAETLSRLLEAITSELLGKARAQSDKLKADLHVHTPEAWKGASLSRIALGALLSDADVTSVLVGMRRPAYVDDALGAVVLPPLSPEARTAVFGLFGRRGGAEADDKA